MKRKQIRLRYFDYRRTGVYFVTICTHDRRPSLGAIRDGDVQLSPLGRVAKTCWETIPNHSPNVELDRFVVMPNHIHGLIALDSISDPSDSARIAGELRPGSLGAVVGSLKSSVTRIARSEGIVGDAPVWQRSFWEHIVRGPQALERIRSYIVANPSRWYCDRENRDRSEDDPFDIWIAEQGALSR